MTVRWPQICALVALTFVAGHSGAAASAVPASRLTPGIVTGADAEAVCRRGYSASVRPRGIMWRRLKEEVYARYGLARGHRSTIDGAGRRHPAYVIDHLVPIELGGAANDVRNLWPQPVVESKQKDRAENRLHMAVCAGNMTLGEAQRAILRQWH
ncbi:MAG: hypothetical protein NVS2B17_17860 [Candidatus Velthaea sp.]